jgi:ATP-binding cassette subfamily A (ABC1) protein 3
MASALINIVPIYLTMIFMLQVRVLLTRILEEKERKIKIALKIMGLSDLVFWSSWLITALVKNTLLITVAVVIISVAGIWSHTSFGVVWIFFFLFELTTISFCFACTALFSKSRTGGAIGMLVYLALSAPSYALTDNSVSSGVKLFLAIFAPCAFSQGASLITTAESRRIGITMSNFNDPRWVNTSHSN